MPYPDGNSAEGKSVDYRKLEYFQRRAENERLLAASSEGIVRECHQRFANTYAAHVAAAKAAPLSADDLSG